VSNFQYPEGTTARDIDALCDPTPVDRGCTRPFPGKSVIHTECICPPIPSRKFDWQATLDDYEPGCAVGHGETKEAAIADLTGILIDAILPETYANHAFPAGCACPNNGGADCDWCRAKDDWEQNDLAWKLEAIA
jgi:hypothetical protein